MAPFFLDHPVHVLWPFQPFNAVREPYWCIFWHIVIMPLYLQAALPTAPVRLYFVCSLHLLSAPRSHFAFIEEWKVDLKNYDNEGKMCVVPIDTEMTSNKTPRSSDHLVRPFGQTMHEICYRLTDYRVVMSLIAVSLVIKPTQNISFLNHELTSKMRWHCSIFKRDKGLHHVNSYPADETPQVSSGVRNGEGLSALLKACTFWMLIYTMWCFMV